MSAKIKNHLGDGRDASVLDETCAMRPCLHIAEDKGSFTVGFGYPNYSTKPRLVCMTRHADGCPYPLPAPDPEMARCCPAVDFAPVGKHPPRKQRCRNCGAWRSGAMLLAVRELPRRPASRCNHSSVAEEQVACEKAWHCGCCALWWNTRPAAYAVGEAGAAFWSRLMAEWRERVLRETP